jgi:alpha-beta hydrolase superfamily lysophospholipase
MQHQEGTFAGSDGLQLYYQCWLPFESPRAVLAIVHGIGEHGGRYNYVVDRMVPCDIAVCAMDLRGHGQSPGKRGAVDRWDQYVEDVGAFLDAVRKNYPNQPLFLMGHSMGGLICALYLEENQDGLAGAVLSSPLLAQANVPGLLKRAVRIVAKVAPGVGFSATVDPSIISRDPAEVQRFVSDPLIHREATVQLGSELLRVLPLAHKQAGNVTLPLLIYHGDDDQLVPVSGSQRFSSAVASSDRVFRIYPGGYHELHNDLNRDQVLGMLHAWLERHID